MSFPHTAPKEGEHGGWTTCPFCTKLIPPYRRSELRWCMYCEDNVFTIRVILGLMDVISVFAWLASIPQRCGPCRGGGSLWHHHKGAWITCRYCNGTGVGTTVRR